MRYGILGSLLSDPRSTLIVLLLALPGRLLAISAHESAHAWVADRCGDPTGRLMGRITLNPLAHLDPLGLACMLLLGIGWAKPVPVNPRNFRNYRKDDLKVSLAGITMNLVLFFLGSIVYYAILGLLWRRGFYLGGGVGYYLLSMLDYFVLTNISLAIFNLIPLPPLDGYHVLNDLVLKRSLFANPRAVMTGQAILLIAMYSGVLSRFLNLAVGGALSLMEALVQLLGII